jgi:hypothetical protein
VDYVLAQVNVARLRAPLDSPPYAFTLRERLPPPDTVSSGPLRSPEESTCPA